MQEEVSQESVPKEGLPRQTFKQKKVMTIMLIFLAVLFGGIFAYKIFMNYMIKKYMGSMGAPTFTVSTMKVGFQSWQPKLHASGSLRAVKGVDVTTEIAGLIRSISFTPGQQVKAKDELVQLNNDSDTALLHSLEATAELARIVYKRDKAQFDIQAVSQAVLDSDDANVKAREAQVAEQTSLLAKKTIRAPFDGRLGISYVNPGQYLNPGDKVVTLQALDPIYVDFYLPQQTLMQLHVGQVIKMNTDAFPGRIFNGKITTIDPLIDVKTRNIRVEATVKNEDLALLPGMFSNVEVDIGVPEQYITLPQTAISYNPYGDIVFIVKENGKDKEGKPLLTVIQSFVTLGDKRGDQVAVKEGLKEGQMVVTAGTQKLKNGSKIAINNEILPSNSPNPHPINE